MISRELEVTVNSFDEFLQLCWLIADMVEQGFSEADFAQLTALQNNKQVEFAIVFNGEPQTLRFSPAPSIFGDFSVILYAPVPILNMVREVVKQLLREEAGRPYPRAAIQIIPTEFAAIKDNIEQSKRHFIHIEPYEIDKPLLPWQSKYLGTPYLPKGMDYPQNIEGKPLYLLAQINFAEVPALENYPTEGILQIFIANDDLYGMEFVEPYDPQRQFALQKAQRNFKVIYHPQVTTNAKQLAQEDYVPPAPGTLPVDTECRLEFSIREEYVPLTDLNFARLLGSEWAQKISKDETLFEAYSEAIHSSGNKIGGYADFCQEDIRALAPQNEVWLLLLQINSADYVEIMWGDAGVGNFFIRATDLVARNFSNVLYNWDCA